MRNLLCLPWYVCSCVISQLLTNYSALVLDPNVKDLYFRARWDSVRYNAGMKELGEVVCVFLYLRLFQYII